MLWVGFEITFFLHQRMWVFVDAPVKKVPRSKFCDPEKGGRIRRQFASKFNVSMLGVWAVVRVSRFNCTIFLRTQLLKKRNPF